MLGMDKLRRDRKRLFTLLALLALGLGVNQGCARPQRLHPTAANSTATQKLPFHADGGSDSAADSPLPASSPDPRLAASVPFRAGSSGRMLPAGTLLTVQLDSSLSADTAGAGDAFTASVAAPLTIDGDTLLPVDFEQDCRRWQATGSSNLQPVRARNASTIEPIGSRHSICRSKPGHSRPGDSSPEGTPSNLSFDGFGGTGRSQFGG